MLVASSPSQPDGHAPDGISPSGGHAHAHEHDDGVPPGFALIAPTHSLRKAQEWLFVLRSVGLDGVVRQLVGGGFVLMVQSTIRDEAVRQLTDYEAENREAAQPRKRDRALYGASPWAALTMVAMVAFYALTGPVRGDSKWFRAGIADAGALLHGAPWQAVTALTLHSDSTHVLGNAASGFLFLTAVHQRLGAGLGTFTVLAAGAAGNVMNAVWHKGDHRSLGASTAVLAAVGVLASTQFLMNLQIEKKWTTWVAPILGGLALLGTIGANPHSDLYAHLWGLVAGMAFGLFVGLFVRRRTTPLSTPVQASFGVLSAASVLGSWGLALAPRL